MLLPVIDWKAFWRKRGLRVLLVSVGAAIGLGGIGVVGYLLWPEPAPKPPPAATATPTDKAEYIASDDFARLPVSRRLSWVEGQMRKAETMDGDSLVNAWRSLDEAKRDRFRDNMRVVLRERTKREVDRYFSLPPEERTAYIDERLDEMNRWEPKMRRIFGRGGQRGGSRTWGQDASGDARSGGPSARSGSDARRSQVRSVAKGASQGVRRPPVDETDLRRREVRAVRERIRSEAQRFMVKESPDRRAKTVTYFGAIVKRRAQRQEGGLFQPEKR